MNNSARNAQYKVLPFLAMLSITLSLLVHFFRRKYIWLNGIEVANLIIAFWYLLNDLIAEVYGYKVSMKIFLTGVICEYIFLGIYYAVMYLPSYNGYSQNSFAFVLGQMWDEILYNPIVLLISWSINARLLIKWKILLSGKYFWIRSIFASGIGELLLGIMILPKLAYFLNFKQALTMITWIIIFKFFFTSIFAFPISLIANILKMIEKNNLQKSQNIFNPFKKEKSAET